MRQWLSDLDDKSAGLNAAVVYVARIMRQVADDPEQVEGDLRHQLREGARLVETLGGANRTLIEFNRRAVVRFGYLSALFSILLAFNVLSLFFR